MDIQVNKLSYSYDGINPVLNNISFSIPSGKMVCLLGPNGSGKSTLFKCMLSLISKYSGSILFDGNNIKKMTQKQLSRNAAYIPQSSTHAFNYSVKDVVLMGTTSLAGGFASPGKTELAYVDKALRDLNIGHLRDRMYMNISGGERQLVLIARALAQQAKTLLMDEPTANLDYGNQVRVLGQIKELTAMGYTVIQSTHNPDQAFMYADEVLALYNGQIAAYGAPNEVMDKALLEKLYNVDVLVESLHNGNVRVCIPEAVVRSNKSPDY